MGGLALMALAGWILATAYIAPVMVSLIVIALMVVTGVVTWNDILGNRQAWNVFLWFGTTVALADGLNQVGFLNWIAQRSAAGLAGLPVLVTAVGLVAVFFISHYLFSSATAHATAVLPAFLAAVVVVPGMPVRPVVYTLLFALGLMGVITPYATGPAPIWASAGYITAGEFWKMGTLMGLLYLGVLLAVELPFLLYVVP